MSVAIVNLKSSRSRGIGLHCASLERQFLVALLGFQGFVYSKFSQVKEHTERSIPPLDFQFKEAYNILGLLLIAASREVQSIYPQKQSLWDCFYGTNFFY